MKIGERIKKIRLSKGWTLEEAANKIGYNSRSALFKIENDSNGITIDKLQKIAEAFEVSIDEILHDEYDYVNIKNAIMEAEKAFLVDDMLFSIYRIHSETYYDMAIIAPTWYPEKIFDENDVINLLQKGTYESSYEIYHKGIKILYIQCGAGASNVMDAMLCLTKANVKNIYFVGAVGSLTKKYAISTLLTPSMCISYDGVTPFLKSKIDKNMYGNVIIPYNFEKINGLIELAKSNNIEIKKVKVFCTDSIVLEYIHMDEILSSGAEAIEMETAAFYSCLKAINKSGMAILIVTDNREEKKSLIEKQIDDKNEYYFVRSNILKKLFEIFTD